MLCPICEQNAWQIDYRPDGEVLHLKCIVCNKVTLEFDMPNGVEL